MFSFFSGFLLPAWRIKGKNRYDMTKLIDQIEMFLRGQMSQKEERVFKTSLMTDDNLRSLAFIVVFMLRMQKTW